MSRRVGQPKCGRAHTESRNSGRAESGPGRKCNERECLHGPGSKVDITNRVLVLD